MTTAQNSERPRLQHKGPPLGIVAGAFVLLFLIGLYPVTAFNGKPVFPAPHEPLSVIMTYFQVRSSAVLLCAALHFGAAVPLGIFTATAVSRLRFLGVRAAGVDIAQFGGFLTAFMMMVSSSVLWAMTYSGVAQDGAVIEALSALTSRLAALVFPFPSGCSWRVSPSRPASAGFFRNGWR